MPLIYHILVLLLLFENIQLQSIVPGNWTVKSTTNNMIASSTVICDFFNDHYVGRLTSGGTVTIWNKEDLNSTYSFTQGQDSLLYITESLIKADLRMSDSKRLYLLTKFIFYEIDIPTGLIVRSENIPNANDTGQQYTPIDMQVTQTSLYILTSERIFLRYMIEDFSIYYEYRSFFGPQVFKFQKCEPIYPIKSQQEYTQVRSQVPNFEYLSIWNAFRRIRVFECEVNSYKCTIIVNRLVDVSEDQNLTQTNFNYDCTKSIDEFDGENSYGIHILDLQRDMEVYAAYSLPLNSSPISSVTFIDYDQSYFVAFDSSNSLSVYDTSLSPDQSLVQTQPTNFKLDFTTYDLHKETFYSMSDYSVSVSKLECQSGFAYHSIGKCVACPSECINSCQNTTGKCLVSNSGSEEEQINKRSRLNDIYLSQTEEEAVKTMEQILSKVTNIAAYALLTLSAIPLSIYFLKFISFWTVCSFYAFLQIQMPHYLRRILTEIYTVINSSILNMFGIEKIPRLYLDDQASNQKLDRSIVETFEINSDFFAMNFQNLILFCFSMVILTLIYTLLAFKNKSNSIGVDNSGEINSEPQQQQSLFELDTLGIIAGQILSFFPSIAIGIFLLKFDRDFSVYSQKINLAVFLLLIGVALIFPLLVLSSRLKQYKQQNETKSQKKIRKKVQKGQLIQKLMCFFQMQCNILIPFLAIWGNIFIFLSAGFALYALGIYCAFKERQPSKLKRINRVVLSFWLILFHLGVVGMYFFRQDSHQTINHFLSMISLSAILLGALHQVSSLLIVDFLIGKIIAALKYHCWDLKAKEQIRKLNPDNSGQSEDQEQSCERKKNKFAQGQSLRPANFKQKDTKNKIKQLKKTARQSHQPNIQGCSVETKVQQVPEIKKKVKKNLVFHKKNSLAVTDLATIQQEKQMDLQVFGIERNLASQRQKNKTCCQDPSASSSHGKEQRQSAQNDLSFNDNPRSNESTGYQRNSANSTFQRPKKINKNKNKLSKFAPYPIIFKERKNEDQN